MALLEKHFVSLVVFLPLAWGLLGLVIPEESSGKTRGWIRGWAFAGSLLTFALSLKLVFDFQPGNASFQWGVKMPWIPMLGSHYEVGVDGISLWLILLTTFLMPISIVSSFTAIRSKEKGYYFLLLLLESAMLGSFVALDVFLFYLFWEAMLIPMIFLIGIWGGKARVYAAVKFFLFTLSGSLVMLVAIFYLAYQHKLQFGIVSTSLLDFYKLKVPFDGLLSAQSLLFWAFSLAFAVKVPMFPLHTWLPDAHVEAPTAGSVILAGILLKLGGYGFLRFVFPLFPVAVQAYQGIFLVLAVVAILYGAWVAMVQPDMKKLVAYSSVSHMGFVILGLFSLHPIAMLGSYYQMLSHGISTGALFLLVGVIYQRRHSRFIADLGGLAKVMPSYALVFMVITFSSIGVPGTNGFIGEFLILLGSWKDHPVAAAGGGLGVIFSAVYMLWLVQRVFFGEVRGQENLSLKDLFAVERAYLLPMVGAVIYMGLLPNHFLKTIEPSVTRLGVGGIHPTSYSLLSGGMHESKN